MWFALALTETGDVYAWGYNYYGQIGDGTNTNRLSPTLISSLSDIIEIGTGRSHSMALKSDGALYVWGNNDYGQLGDGTTTDSSVPAQSLQSIVIPELGGGEDEDDTYLTTDSDGDGIPDYFEEYLGMDPESDDTE